MSEDPSIGRLSADLATVRTDVEAAGDRTLTRWSPWLQRPDFEASARNLAHFLALRGSDRTDLQRRLRRRGMSTLGRSEGHVVQSLRAIEATLAGQNPDPDVVAGLEWADVRLRTNTAELFGPRPPERLTRILVTLSPELGADRARLQELIRLGMNAVRINCGRDDPETWRRMAETARAAAREAGADLRVLLDLAGPKIRTSGLRVPNGARVTAGDRVRLRRAGGPPPAERVPSFTCTLDAALDAVQPGAVVSIDDGTIWAIVETANGDGLDLRITHTKPGGAKLKAQKGLNFPGTALAATSMTPADRAALPTVADMADLIGCSFVQRPDDIDDLLDALAAGPTPRRPIGLIAKVETDLAFRNLPEIIVRGAGRRPFGVMVARGDLGVEVGFSRLSEVQEEILWLCEAAHIPVVWATEVLARLIKSGVASRGEFTDAAMSARAECVMLNRGPFIADGVRTLADVLRRSERHLDKKTPQLARLRAWQAPLT